MLKTNQHIALQSREILKAFVFVCTIQTSENFRNFAEQYLRSLKTLNKTKYMMNKLQEKIEGESEPLKTSLGPSSHASKQSNSKS